MSDDDIIDMVVQCEAKLRGGPPIVVMKVEHILAVLYALAAARHIKI